MLELWHRLSKTRKKKNGKPTGAKKAKDLKKDEQRLMKRRDKNTEKAAKRY